MTVTEKNSIFELLAPILDIDGIELVDVETQLQTLRILIHKPEGLTVSDCQAVNRVVRPILEVHQHLASYTQLEVASPGLDRPLRTAADFQRNCGRTVQIEVDLENDGNYQVQGTVIEVSDEKVILAPDNGKHVTINISEIRNAHIHLKW
jgi:ribosome maturation factor RimP